MTTTEAEPAAVGGAATEHRHATTVLAGGLRRALVGLGRIALFWPGMVVLVLAYAAVAGGLYGHSYSNLWGALAATVVGVAWYLSPLRRVEARRRKAPSTGG